VSRCIVTDWIQNTGNRIVLMSRLVALQDGVDNTDHRVNSKGIHCHFMYVTAVHVNI